MPGTLDYVERRFQVGFLIPLVDVLALAERHVPVLVAVKDEQRRIVLCEIIQQAVVFTSRKVTPGSFLFSATGN